MIDWFDLPKLTTFTAGSYSFFETASVTLTGMISSSYSPDVPFDKGTYNYGAGAFIKLKNSQIKSTSFIMF